MAVVGSKKVLMPPIHRIVLTGGPCAGKSSALDRVGAWLADCGIQVFRVPEASTLLLGGGIDLAGRPRPVLQAFQRGIVEVQLALEDAFSRLARASEKASVLLIDRGIPDGFAYLAESEWAELLDEMGLVHHELRDRRYDAVVHLTTAAIGAEAHYGMTTNPRRYETLEEARGVDERLRAAWLGHPRASVIDNATDFETKMHGVLLAVCAIVGVPAPS
jgi:predicted ATPase